MNVIRHLFSLLFSLSFGFTQIEKINYMYHSGYFFDETPSIIKVNLDSQDEVSGNLDFEFIMSNSFLFDVSNDQSHILLCEYNDEENGINFSDLPPLILYNHIEKDTLIDHAYNAKFTSDDDIIIYMQIDSIISPLNPGGDGYISRIMSYSINSQESSLIADSVSGVEFLMSHDKSKILFFVGVPSSEDARIIIHDLNFNVSDTLNYNSGFPPIFNSIAYNSFFWGKDNNLYIPSLYYPEADDSTLAIYKLDVSQNPEAPSLYYAFEDFVGGYVLPYADHNVNKFVITAAQTGQSTGMYSFDVSTGELDLIHGWYNPYVIPTMHTWSADSSKFILGMFGFMGLQLGLSVYDIETNSFNGSGAYFPRFSRNYGHNICTFDVPVDSILSDFSLSYPGNLDTLYFSQSSVNDSTTFAWEESHSPINENVNYTFSFWYSEYLDILGYARSTLYETTTNTNQITFLNSLILDIYEDAYLQPDFVTFGWSVRASNGVNLGNDLWEHAFLGISAGHFQAQSNAELANAVSIWISDNNSALSLYGHINTWDVSQVTNMSGLFANHTNFNDIISDWDVSSVTSMKQMFGGAERFNQNIDAWDVSAVTNMEQMFFNADSFDQNISMWDVSNVDSMDHIFNMITNNLSHDNKCAIHNSWVEKTTAWIYNWSIFCSLSNNLIDDIPKTFVLHQNYPNPFNPITKISYELPIKSDVSISIYDVKGRYIKSFIMNEQEAGQRSVYWNATNDFGQAVSAGMYIYTIQAGDFRQIKKMVLLK